MSVIINSNFEENEKDYYDNLTKHYAKFFVDNYYTPSLISNQYSNWTSITVNEDNGYMIAIASNSNGTSTHNLIYSSDGGLEWSSINYTNDNSNVTLWKDITFNDSKYVAVGGYINSANNYVLIMNESLSSIQGIKNSASGTSPNTWNSITYGGGFFAAVSEDGNNRLMTSTDGLNWISKIIPLQTWKKIIYGKGVFLAVSSSSSGTNTKIIYSLDNTITWNYCVIDVFTDDITNQSIVFCSKINKFILSFYYAINTTNYIYYSEDGINWIKGSQFSGSDRIVKSITWSQELQLVIITLNSSTGFNLIFSNNGINWTTKKTNFNFNNSFIKIIWNRFFSNFIIINDKKSSGSIITTKNFGVNNFIEKNKYYDPIFLNQFDYLLKDIKASFNQYFYSYPILNIKNEGIYYSINSELPDGISINNYNGVISGSYNSSTYFPKTEYIVTANDLINNQKMKIKIFLEFFFKINPINIFYYNNNQTLNLLISDTNTIISPTIVGTPAFNFVINNNPNSSLFSINPYNGYITISQTQTIDTTLNLTVNNLINSFSTDLRIIIKNRAPTSFNYNNGAEATLIVNRTHSYIPSQNTGTNLTYTISSNISNLPGSSINSNTGVITIVTPLTPSPSRITLTITASNESGTINVDFTVNIKNEDITVFKYNSITSPIVLNDLINSSSVYTYNPSIQTGTNVSYSIVSSPSILPNQFTFNNGIISGTPKVSANLLSYTIRASNDISYQEYTFIFNFYYLNGTITCGGRVDTPDVYVGYTSLVGFATTGSGFNFGSMSSSSFNGKNIIFFNYYEEKNTYNVVTKSNIQLGLNGSADNSTFNSITIGNNTINVAQANYTYFSGSNPPQTQYYWNSTNSYTWFKNLYNQTVSITIR